FEAQAVADRLRHVELVLDDQQPHDLMLETLPIAGISKTENARATPRRLQWRHDLSQSQREPGPDIPASPAPAGTTARSDRRRRCRRSSPGGGFSQHGREDSLVP